ncbi:MAG: hypothetical protein QOF14_619 [Hyphomicrobiales bacterium]|nr:hypothetical protein [Hyphomicrobiales bacterium]
MNYFDRIRSAVVASAALLVVCLLSTVASAQVVSIRSDAFPNVFLRLDGRGITAFLPSGGGVVNSQFGCYSWERFREVPVGGGRIALQSVAFPGVYLRLDGRGVTGFLPSGGGVVNAQFGHYAWEEFWPRPQLGGPNKFTYESVAFPNVFLRLDGSGVTSFLPSGGGVVNVQFAAYGWEHFTRVPNC